MGCAGAPASLFPEEVGVFLCQPMFLLLAICKCTGPRSHLPSSFPSSACCLTHRKFALPCGMLASWNHVVGSLAFPHGFLWASGTPCPARGLCLSEWVCPSTTVTSWKREALGTWARGLLGGGVCAACVTELWCQLQLARGTLPCLMRVALCLGPCPLEGAAMPQADPACGSFRPQSCGRCSCVALDGLTDLDP